jgi:predicted  nucleic acid-binding Zn-ribbon protein
MDINELLKEVSQITKRHHEVRVMDYMEMAGTLMIALEELLGEYEDLQGSYEHLEDEFRYFKQDVEDNYKPITKEEQIYG